VPRLLVTAALALLVVPAPVLAREPGECRRVRGAEALVRLGAVPLTARAGNLARENAVTKRERLSQIRSREMLRRFVRAGHLVRVPADARTFWIDGVGRDFQVARPWTRRFIVQLAAGYHARFGARIKITGLTRTADFQRRLRLTNGNAAPPAGAAASSHLTGAAVDIGTRDVSVAGRAWLRHVLRQLAGRKLLLAIEELRYPHFHVVVRRAYLEYARTLRAPSRIGGC
jgi:hypothetical protein